MQKTLTLTRCVEEDESFIGDADIRFEINRHFVDRSFYEVVEHLNTRRAKTTQYFVLKVSDVIP